MYFAPCLRYVRTISFSDFYLTKCEVLAFAFLFTNANTLTYAAGGCDGIAKNSVNKKAPPKDYQVVEGSRATLEWEYCKKQIDSVSGIIISRKNQIKPYLLAMDVTGKIYYYKANRSRHNVSWSKENGSIVFSIMNISMADGGHYTLEIRRVGYADFQNTVNVIVHRAEKPNWYPSKSTSILKDITKTSVFLNLYITPTSMNVSYRTSGSKETSFTHYPSTVATTITHKVLRNIVSTTKRQENGSSENRHHITISRKSSVKDKEEYDDIVLIVIYILAGIATMMLFSVMIALRIKLQKRRKERSNARREFLTDINANIQSPSANITNHRERDEARIELDDSFSVSSMSGFSYRDSLGLNDASEEEPFSAITFGIRQPGASLVCHDFPTTPTHEIIEQDASCPLLPKRKNYEVQREFISDLKIIGQGAFGLVARANMLLKNELCVVAVKMLKEFASNEDRRDLISECQLMRSLEYHKNVVQLLGFVLQSEPIWVVTEYAAHGDLLGFLRKCRGIQDSVYHGVDTYCGSSLTQKQLLNMAKDIACGMAHLSRNDIIHRDLAARNVLVDENISCKITDFGMARDIKTTSYYRVKNRGRIPLKWTAIEAILDERYTTMSDVWSYGVVLYEIVTIGRSPYPRLGPGEILRRLKRGWRMERPEHVNIDLYNVMLTCWAANSEERPSFLSLSAIFSSLLGNESEYINMKGCRYQMFETLESSSESEASTGSLSNELST
ncbi:hepatocyte growth factor receptor-like [Dendronephthya gigantea]|uniref:hepatocyte growth factor receptor-like n=1 Tax=Dendronephthya gigantea TaxID=151771 RepID=UPI00106DA6A9|nr:hepatocyte growth factor receptor-like [Dendronephthya gigantea]